MVRFIINEYCLMIIDNVEIYIPIWLDLLFVLLFIVIPPFLDLHSNMVRFIIQIAFNDYFRSPVFTFQYG